MARVESKKAADAQAKDVERSRKAAEDSAEAASRSADASWNSVVQLGALVATGRAQLKSSERIFEIEQSPFISTTVKSFTDKPPRMDALRPTEVTIEIRNSGKPAFRCQIKLAGKFDHPTDKFDYSTGTVFPGILGLGPDFDATIPVRVTPPPSLSPAGGDVRLFLYGRADCAETLAPSRPYHTSWCMFYPVSASGDIVDFVHGCSEGDPSRVSD